MSKWIDVDALYYYGSHIDDEYEDKFHEAQWVYRNQIDEAPSIDIVRCCECKFWAGNSDGDIDDWAECRWREDEATDADDFCSYGERREP